MTLVLEEGLIEHILVAQSSTASAGINMCRTKFSGAMRSQTSAGSQVARPAIEAGPTRVWTKCAKPGLFTEMRRRQNQRARLDA